ncbi:hypothetical protein BGX34_006877, partial [Mortierella sp. NVP85]
FFTDLPVGAGPLGSRGQSNEFTEVQEALLAVAKRTPVLGGADIDYCALAAASSNNSQGFIPYTVAKGCYEMFAFDPRIRDDTLKNVRSNLESFYVFYDIAKYEQS